MRMDFGITENAQDILMDIFKRYPEVSEVLVYGSRAKENYGERSDLDLVVVDPIDRFVLGKLIMDINESDFPYTVDIQIFGSIQNKNLINHISRVGRVFYNKERDSVKVS